MAPVTLTIIKPTGYEICHQGPCKSRSLGVETVFFVIVAIVLYVAADRILDRLEIAAGRRFEYRTLYFFGILLVLALITFSLINALGGR